MHFRGKFSFLSNFYLCNIFGFPSVEHAYQAAKTLDAAERKKIQQTVTPAEVKRLGRQVTLRAGWNEMRLTVMETLLREKFCNPELLRRLQDITGEIVEDNWWGDRYWGRCGNIGRNELGKLLMKIRDS